MQILLASIVFATTLLFNYGYFVIPGVPARVFYAMQGLQELALIAVIIHLVFHRWTSWRATVVLMLALMVSTVESLMVFVCGSWYAFVYSGPVVPNTDRCEMMTGLRVSREVGFALATLTAIILPRVWGKTWGTLR